MNKLNVSLSSKDLWKNLKDVGVCSSKSISKCPLDPQEMKSFFAPTQLNSSLTLVIPENDNELFSFNCVEDIEVVSALKSVKSNASGTDNISPKFIRLILPIVIKPLKHILNTCISSSQFPEAWKSGIIVPIPKKANSSEPSDYRPINLLPFFGKIFERLMFNQMLDFIQFNQKLSKWQSGFRNKHSCESAVLKVTSDFRAALDKDLLGVMVLLDFSKAFDCVDHQILISKLSNKFSFSKTALKLLSNYLCNRLQMVTTNQGNSSTFIVNQGVPQGSVLGPLLFSIFINDLPDIVYSCHTHMYADDVLLYNFSELGLMENCIVRVNEDLTSIQKWSLENKLLLNPSKTLCMICSRSEVTLDDLPKIVLNSQVVDYVSKVKYLGFQINNKLTCCDAISDTIRRVYYSLRSLRSSSNILDTDLRKHLVKSLVMPSLTFNCNVYPSLDYECKRKLNVAFNDCLRFIYNIPRHESVSNLHSSLLGLNFEKYLMLRNVILLNNIIHNRSPAYLGEMLQFAHSQRGLRLILPRFTHTIAERSYFVKAIRLWNGLPFDLQRTTSPTIFKKKLFELLSSMV